ncbi:uncharacterized protein moto [Antennarius striatus]|uniref:uncharacterized protein moto n=1 Tax=Antennarius striatus TaxID=241820 RepID=UPI0035B3D443
MAEQWKATNPASPSQMNPAVHTPTQLTGKLGLVQIKKNGGLRNQEHTRDGFPVVPEYFQQPKSFPESNGFPNQYQNKMKMHRGTHSLPASMVTNQYSKNHIQQGQIQSKFLPQIQKEKRTNMPGFVEEFPTRHKTQAPLQRFDHFWSMQSQKILSENGMKKVVNTQHSAGDPRKHSNVTNGHTNFNCRSTPPNGGFVPSMDRGGMSANEFSALKSSTWLNGGRPGVQFYSYLNECNDQWTCLEKERQRVEAILNKEFPNQRPMAEIDPGLPRVPPNATVVDHLIANQMRERGKVENLLHRMEILSKVPLHINIHMVLNKQRIAITSLLINWVTQKDNMLKHQQRRARFKDDRETLLVVVALKDLSVTTRRLRTALWSALHMTLPRPVRRQDQHVNREEAVTESPIWGFSFIV